VLMDPRVLSRGYGEMLLETLPPAKRVTGPWKEVRPQLEQFFQPRLGHSVAKPRRSNVVQKVAE
jgi:hypothetical protein